uniref:Dynein heavy chain, cytoplasmic n=1 Tax=Culex pipiens TaxID=7175 RepID=A0A8D8IZB0_CULPI
MANGAGPGLFEGVEYTTLMTQCQKGAQREVSSGRHQPSAIDQRIGVGIPAADSSSRTDSSSLSSLYLMHTLELASHGQAVIGEHLVWSDAAAEPESLSSLLEHLTTRSFYSSN